MPAKGAHAALLARSPCSGTMLDIQGRPLLLLLFLLVSSHFMLSFGLTDAEVLLKFKASLGGTSGLANWNDGVSPCTNDTSNWNGVICVDGSVRGLRLEKMGLTGKLDFESLLNLQNLKTISLMNNNLEGPLPEFKKLGGLRSVFLSNNKLSGEIPRDAFDGMSKLKKVYIAENDFTGVIPASLGTLPKLLDLRLEGNEFTGQLPNFTHQLKEFNVSNNQLVGPIPASLGKMELSAFAGNKGLCGQPMNQCNTIPPAPDSGNGSTSGSADDSGAGTGSGSGKDSGSGSSSDAGAGSGSGSSSGSKNKKHTVASTVIVIIVASIALIAIIVAAIILLRRRKRSSSSVEAPAHSNLQKKTGLREQGKRGSTENLIGKKGEATKLSFVRDDRERFDLPDLLKASAEILGSGCFGSSYKAALTTGAVMVVKRFKQMNNVGREEFQEHMRRLGRLSHPNLLPLVAYYYRKEEKLLVTDYINRGNLAVHLHGYEGIGQRSLEWPTRLKIVKGVVKGLGYLQKELPSMIATHGHLKSSNVLLSESFEPLLTDYALVPVINQEDAHELMAAYKSPEYVHHGRITKKTDVWTLGMLILEILTGKFPANFLPQAQGKGSNDEDDLVSWVNSVPQEEWSSKVLDKEIGTSRGHESEVIKLLKIALCCCENDVEKRLDLREAIERIDEIREKDIDDDFYSSYASDGEVMSKRGTSDDFNFA